MTLIEYKFHLYDKEKFLTELCIRWTTNINFIKQIKLQAEIIRE